MKKIVCFLAVLGILISGALFIISSLTVPLHAEVYGWAVDKPGGGYNCISCNVVNCWSRIKR